MKKVLLLEDDQSLGATLSERLIREKYHVEWVKDLASARKAAEQSKFDLAILDVGLPDGSGFDWAKELRTQTLMPFIFVTARGSAEDRLKGYEIGAEEYIPKPFHLKELLMRVRHVLENHGVTPTIERENARIDVESLRVERAGKFESLTLKEASLLKLLIDRSPKAVSRDEILEAVWGEQEFPSNRTVDNVIVRLRQILGREFDGAIESVRGLGYRWVLDVKTKGDHRE
jgi:two-component system, OmpR family, phosphate regulon response regulator PhoB